jgi:glucose 1-dehydrogenase
MKLKDKVAIVTGSTSGMGRAIAILFASEGARVTVTGRSEKRLDDVVKTIKASKGECLGILASLTKLREINRVVENTVREFGKLDILVNCVGIFQLANFLEISEEFYDRTMHTNLKSTFFMCQRAAKEMIKRGEGKIINFASIGGGKIGLATGSVYCASKGGVVSLTQALAVELAPYHINVNAISPGNIRTAMNEKLLADPDYLTMMLDMTPWGRIGETKDVTFAALYLASEESDYVTGIQLVIDGGIVAK